MPQTLALVKRQLGLDAVIVHTRTIRRGGLLGIGARNVVEITARKNDGSVPKRKVINRNARLRQIYNTSVEPAVAAKTPVINAQCREIASNVRRDNNVAPRSGTTSPGRNDEILKKEIGDIRDLVENLVKEQRQLHAPQMPEQLFDLYLDLVQREVADEIAREMIADVQSKMTGDQILSSDLVRQRLVQVMDNMISTCGPISHNIDGAARVVVLIGPTGVGKTTSIAKIAANLKLRQNKKVGMITIDTYRIGAVDQLRMYAQIIDVPLKVVLTPTDLKEAVESMRHENDVILIDTAGRSHNDELKLQELRTFLTAANADEVHLVLSSTANHSNMISAAEKFGAIGIDRVILTKLDEAISFGVVLSVLRKVDASLSYITTGQDVPDDIEVAGGKKLARMLLGLESAKYYENDRQVGRLA